MKKLLLTVFCLIFSASIVSAQSPKVDKFKTRKGAIIEFAFFRHASISITYTYKKTKKVIYVDPVSQYADYSKLPKADVILITHEHADHLDANAVTSLKKESTLIIANRGAADALCEGYYMLNGDKTNPASWLDIEAVPAYNTTAGREVYHPRGHGNGYIITIDGVRIYVAGDTENIEEMRGLGQIDVAFLPVNQPYTMTVKQAVKAAKVVNASYLYPYHYGDTNIGELKSLLGKRSRMKVLIRDLQ